MQQSGSHVKKQSKKGKLLKRELEQGAENGVEVRARGLVGFRLLKLDE